MGDSMQYLREKNLKKKSVENCAGKGNSEQLECLTAM